MQVLGKLQHLWNVDSFTWVSKVIHVYFDSAFPHLVIPIKNLHCFLNQSDKVKPKPTVTWGHFPMRQQYVIIQGLFWPLYWLTFFKFVIGHSNYFGFGFTTLSWKLIFL